MASAARGLPALLSRLSSFLPRARSSPLPRIPPLAAYGLVAGASAAMNTVFVLYYIELFTQTIHAAVTPAGFYAGQTIYM